MTSSWWFVWFGTLLLLFVLPVGYGWHYKGWGKPYAWTTPRRRGLHASVYGNAWLAPQGNRGNRGWGGDFIWVVLLGGVFCAVFGLSWR
jgi:hypothetical protein